MRGLPRASVSLGNQYYLLHIPQDTKFCKIEPQEILAYAEFALEKDFKVVDEVKQCGRIRLPNGQDVRSA